MCGGGSARQIDVDPDPVLKRDLADPDAMRPGAPEHEFAPSRVDPRRAVAGLEVEGLFRAREVPVDLDPVSGGREGPLEDPAGAPDPVDVGNDRLERGIERDRASQDGLGPIEQAAAQQPPPGEEEIRSVAARARPIEEFHEALPTDPVESVFDLDLAPTHRPGDPDGIRFEIENLDVGEASRPVEFEGHRSLPGGFAKALREPGQTRPLDRVTLFESRLGLSQPGL